MLRTQSVRFIGGGGREKLSVKLHELRDTWGRGMGKVWTKEVYLYLRYFLHRIFCI